MGLGEECYWRGDRKYAKLHVGPLQLEGKKLKESSKKLAGALFILPFALLPRVVATSMFEIGERAYAKLIFVSNASLAAAFLYACWFVFLRWKGK
jgi:hypothetical protein